MIIDAKGTILGRLGSYAAKQALLGNKVDIVNCEEAIVSGKKQAILQNYIRRIGRKAPGKGPYLYRRPDMFVRRTVRGMLPFKRSRGRNAFRNIKCHLGFPENLKRDGVVNIRNAGAQKLHIADYLKLRDICKTIGWKE